MEWVTLVKDVIVACVAVLGAWIGFQGLQAWRRELNGRAAFDTGRRLLRSAYQVREAIQMLRNPLMTSGEIEAALELSKKQVPGSVAAGDSEAAERAVYDVRWKPLASAMTDLSVASLEAEVLWGGSIREATEPLDACVRQLWVGLSRKFARSARESGLDSLEELEKQQKLIYSYGDTDEYRDRVVAAVRLIEEYAKVHMA